MSVPEGGEYDITIRQGSTFSIQFLARENDETTVIPLTGYTGRAQMRTSGVARTLLLDFTVVIDGPTGSVTLSATATQTALITSSGIYDVELVQGSVVIGFLGGRAFLEQQVTIP